MRTYSHYTRGYDLARARDIRDDLSRRIRRGEAKLEALPPAHPDRSQHAERQRNRVADHQDASKNFEEANRICEHYY